MLVPDPVTLTVSQIRQRIFEVARGLQAPNLDAPGPGSASGRLFHLCASSILDSRSAAYWELNLGDQDGGADRLAEVVYDAVLGPELARCRTALAGEQLLLVWGAVRSFVAWFSKIVNTAQQNGAIRYDPKREVWNRTTGLFNAEVEVSREFREPDWRAPVNIAGRVDQVLRVGNSSWCVLEFKVGAGHAEADALQACLYHEILAATGDGSAASAAALVRFGQGDPEEVVLESERIQQARPAFMKFVGSMAGVLNGSVSRRDPDQRTMPASKQVWPKAPGDAEQELEQRILKCLTEFKAGATLLGEPIVGPSFVRFLVQPNRGVSTSKLLGQSANLQVRLGVNREPVVHMVDGRVAIDVARPSRDAVLFTDLQDKILRGDNGSSKVLIGIDLSNRVEFLDFASPEHAHVLIAGVAGSGKSEWLRTALASLAVANTPDTLRFVLVDPKRNAFLDFAHSQFLLNAQALVHPPQDDVVPVLEGLVEEMERRARLFENARADHLAHYCRKSGAKLPRIIVACDEFADLVMSNRQQRAEIELMLSRLGQKARAAGIHLMIATQSPRREVITGILRANTPARVALRVTTGVESRLILDRGGAEKLLGRGDLLFASNHDPIRLQAPYLPEDDRRAIFGCSASLAVTM